MADEGFKRKLTAILSADVEGYSRLMGEDEEATVRTLTAYREVLTTLIQQHNGKVLDSPGDNLLADFVSVVDAVQCAVAVQKEIKARNKELPENRRMQFRIGINLGDVIQEKNRIYGDGVNIAARLEGLAEPGGICISKTAFEHIESKLPYGYEFLGDQTVKNIVKPVGVYRVLMEPRVIVVEKKKAVELIPFLRRKASVVWGIAAIVLIMGVAVWKFYLPPPPIEPASVERMAFELPDKPSIAVLPFENLSGDSQQEYLSDGISEAIINALSKVPRMFVIARNSSFTYKGKRVKVQHVAEELGVQYVLEGSVQRSGEKLRVTTQLIDALKGHHLWSEQYDIKMDDLLAMQDKIAMNILVETQVKLTEGEQARLLKRETNNLKAYAKYLEASKYYYRTNREDMYKARQLYEEAIQLDPDFSGAYRGIGATHLWDTARRWSQDPNKSWQLATEYARKALDLDENNSFNLLFWSRIVQGNGDHEKAIEIAKHALRMNPNHASAYEALAGTLFNAGRYEEAIPLQEKAGRLNPFPPVSYYRNSGLYYWFAGRYEDAIAASKKALYLNPDDITTYRNLSAIYSTLGQEEKAREAAAEVLRMDPSFNIEREFKNMGWKDREGMERYMDALRRAGLPEKTPLPLPDKPSIAVLPFVNLSDDPKQEYFSDGITENIIMALSKTPKLFVIARNSTYAYKDKPLNIKQISKELGVRYILEGSVQKTENRVRITTQLIDATTGRHQWAERYDRELKDIFALQDEITLEIITALQVVLTEGEQSRIHRGGTTSLEAFLKILKGREHHFRYTKEDMEIAKRMYKDALNLDPKYATAYFWLAYAIDADIGIGWSKSREADIARLLELSEKIFALDESSAQGHIVLSRFYAHRGQPEKAIAEAEIAVELDPNDADGYAFGGSALNQTERYEEALRLFKKAMRLNPSPPNWYISMMGISYVGTGSYEKAIPLFTKAIHMAPTAANYTLYCHTLSLMGKHEQALEIMKKAIDLGRGVSQDNRNMQLSHLAEYFRRTGRYMEAIDTGRKLLGNNPSKKHALRAYITLACAYSALGNDEEARAAAADLLRVCPDFSLDTLTTRDSYMGLSIHDWLVEHEPDKKLLMNVLLTELK